MEDFGLHEVIPVQDFLWFVIEIRAFKIRWSISYQVNL